MLFLSLRLPFSIYVFLFHSHAYLCVCVENEGEKKAKTCTRKFDWEIIIRANKACCSCISFNKNHIKYINNSIRETQEEQTNEPTMATIMLISMFRVCFSMCMRWVWVHVTRNTLKMHSLSALFHCCCSCLSLSINRSLLYVSCTNVLVLGLSNSIHVNIQYTRR